jgi:hypothetical protein
MTLQQLVELHAVPDAAGELAAQLLADRVDVALHALAMRPPPPGLARRADAVGEEPVVPVRHDVDGGAHERALDRAPALEGTRQLGEGEPLEPRPQRDVGRRRVLRLQPADLLERACERQPRALKQKLAREERAVQVARGEDALRQRR